MNITHRIYLIVFITAALFLAPLTKAQNPFAIPQGMPAGMPPADVKKLQDEMAEFQKEFDSLSSTEQESFFKSMDEAIKKIDDLSKTSEGKELLDKLEKGTISDKELDGLINQLVVDDKVDDKKVTEPAVEKPKEPERPKQVITTQHEQIIDTINSLIAHTNAFIVKATTIPELPGKFRRWAKGRYIKIKEGHSWNTLKTDIEKLVSQLNMLLERNAQTKEYYHIEELLKNENLRNNIVKIQKNISKFEPLVEEIPLLEVKKMSIESKRAFHNLINEYYEAIYVLTMLDELEKQFKMFDPIAKKYKDLEAETRKRAEATGKKLAIPARNFASSNDFSSNGSAYAPFSNRSTYSDQFDTIPRKNYPSERFQSHIFSQGKSQPKSFAMAKPDDKKIKAELNPTKKLESTDKEVIRGGTNRFDQDLNLIFSKLEDKLSSFNKTLKDSALLKKIVTSFIDESPIDYTLAVETIPELSKALNMQKGLLGDIYQYHRKASHKNIRQAQQKRIKKLFDENKKEIEEFQKKITEIKKNWSNLKNQVPIAKQYVFFGMKDAEIETPEDASKELQSELAKKREQLAEAKNKIIAPYSVFEISELIDTLQKVINSFDQNTLSEAKKS